MRPAVVEDRLRLAGPPAVEDRLRVAPLRLVDVEPADRHYTIVLDSTAKFAARQTYLTALAGAKAALITIRASVLKAPMAAGGNTDDLAPDFSPLAGNQEIRDILTRRWHECSKCVNADRFSRALRQAVDCRKTPARSSRQWLCHGSDHAMSLHFRCFLPTGQCFPMLARHFRRRIRPRKLHSAPAVQMSRTAQLRGARP